MPRRYKHPRGRDLSVWLFDVDREFKRLDGLAADGDNGGIIEWCWAMINTMFSVRCELFHALCRDNGPGCDREKLPLYDLLEAWSYRVEGLSNSLLSAAYAEQCGGLRGWPTTVVGGLAAVREAYSRKELFYV